MNLTLPTKSQQIISFHPKLLRRLSRVYVNRYIKDGKDVALNWAYSFLPNKWLEKAIPFMEEEMKKAGFKLAEKPPDGDKRA